MLVLKGNIIDGKQKDVLNNKILLIEENKIKGIQNDSEFEIPESAEIIEVKNGTIMPGLIDCHVHYGIGTTNFVDVYMRDNVQKTMMSVMEMKQTLNAGFTSVREAGGLSTSFKEPLEKGWVTGPRICSAGQFISQTGGHGDCVQKFPISLNRERNTHACIVDGKDSCRKAARIQFRNGADYLKIMTSGGVTSQGDGNRESQFSIEEIKTFVEEAQLRGTYVATHAQGTSGIENALKCGVNSIEHGMFMDDECIELMIKNDAYLVPTFTIVNSYLSNLKKLPVWVADKIEKSYEEHFVSVKRCYNAGVKIALGSDIIGDPDICPFGINGREFEYLTRIGMSPMESIMAGTKTASKLMLMEDKIGTLEAGKLADVIICEGNPLKDISILGNADKIKIVIKDGKLIKKCSFDN